jgi:hypothetical protein
MAYAKQWQGAGGAGHWPDCDMIQIGKLSKRGPVGEERYSKFTEDEEYTHMTFWCIFRSPLMLGGNLPETRPFELQLYTNAEVLGVNQTGDDPKELFDDGESTVWYSHVPGSKEVYVAMFNLTEQPKDISVSFLSLGLKGKITVRDLWRRQDNGTYTRRFHEQINGHGAALLKFSDRK